MKYVALFLLFPSVSFAKVKIVDYHLCTNKKIVRTLRVEVDKDKACSTKYSKAGVDKVVGSGMHLESCKRFLNNVKANLKSAGWNCRQVESVKITSASRL